MTSEWDPRARFPNAPLENEWARVSRRAIGLGLVAKKPIPPWTEILVFEGPVIDFPTAVARGDWEGHTLQVGPGIYLDPRPPGVYANHSCDPNAGLRDGVRLVALRAIEAGEEISWDYSTSMAEDYFEMDCHCGAATCRRRVRDFKHLPPETRDRYLALKIVPPFVQDSVR